MNIKGLIVQSQGIYRSDLLIENNVIKNINIIEEVDWKIKREAAFNSLEDSSGQYPDSCLIFPGFIDIHTHCREDITGQHNYKEDFISVGKAALSGGVHGLMDMPNNPSPPADLDSLAAKIKLSQKTNIPIVCYMLLTNQTPEIEEDIPLKFFMGQSFGSSKNSMSDLSFLSRFKNKFISMHLENTEILEKNRTKETYENRRPSEAEVVDIERAIELCDKYGFHLNVCHISTASGLELIKKAKRSGMSVSCEASFHHLFWDIDNKKNHPFSDFLIMNPPLRTPDDRLTLIEGLRNGDIDFLASDHAPHTIEEKKNSVPGIPHLDTYGLACSLLIQDYNISPQIIAKCACENPGKVLSRFNGFKSGVILEGSRLSLTILDFAKSFLFTREHIKSKCKWSPFEKTRFPASIISIFPEIES